LIIEEAGKEAPRLRSYFSSTSTGLVFFFHPSYTVKALVGLQSIVSNQWSDFILSLSTTELLSEKLLLYAGSPMPVVVQ